MPVKSPIRKLTSCPSCWNWRSLWIRTVCPRCRSGAVGSKPALILRGTPLLNERSSFSSSSFSTRISTAPRLMTAICSATDMHNPSFDISAAYSNSLDTERLAVALIQLDDHAVQSEVLFGNLELDRQLGQELADGVFLADADDRIEAAGHAGVGHVGRAL